MATGLVVLKAISALREWLVSAHFKPGARLPSERLLAGQLGIKHNAINRAMSRLISEGLVQREGYRLFYAGEKKTAAAVFSCDLVLARRSLYSRSYRKLAKELGIDLRLHYYESTGEAVSHLNALDVTGTESVLLDAPHVLYATSWGPALARLLAHGIPAISIRQHCAGIPCVLADYSRAVELVVSHLREGGHTEMALVTLSPRAPVAREIHEAWQTLRRQNGFRETAARIAFYDDAREDVRMIADQLTGAWKNVTALVVYADYEPVAPHLIEELARRKRYVPKDLSLICLGDLPHLTASNPPVSTAAFDVQLMQETVFRLAQRLARRKDDVGLLPPVPCVRIEPHLLLRSSTAPLGSPAPAKKPPVPEEHAPAFKTTEEAESSPSELTRVLKAMTRRPYSLTATADEARFTSIDLASFVNRPLNFRKGWLGDLPLAHMDAGKHVIHGVHFRTLGGHSRKECGAIIFRSMTNATGNSRALPASVRIPVEARARALYVLHGCGYTRFVSPFATYAFYAGEKLLGSVPLVALGKPPPECDAARFERESRKANIQDWWPDFPHIDFTNARRAPVVEGGADGAASRHAFLYTLEWINPFPKLKVSHLTITVDTNQSTTLGVLAISVLANADE
ncbi:MAG TPA: substrate-binding domain-containing protein [Rariglobus sp.]